MPRAQVGPDGPTYDLPPLELELLSPELYRYLLALHLRIFGNGNGRGDLGQDNLDLSFLEIRHDSLLGLDSDDHPQYLTPGRHGEIQGNVHGVTAADLGNDVPLWNASQLQGIDVSRTDPTAAQVLTYDVGLEQWAPADLPGPGTAVIFQTTTLELPVSGVGIGFNNMAPQDSVVFAVFAEVVQAISGPTAFSVGLFGHTTAWGDQIGLTAGTTTTISDFQVSGPLYQKNAPLAVGVFAQGGTFLSGRVKLTCRYLVP